MCPRQLQTDRESQIIEPSVDRARRQPGEYLRCGVGKHRLAKLISRLVTGAGLVSWETGGWFVSLTATVTRPNLQPRIGDKVLTSPWFPSPDPSR